MKKHFTYISEKQLWRILVSDSDKLILETRDTETKEVFFDYYELKNNNVVFSNLQLEEKHWIGIESIYKEIIYFHKFPKRDLPGHKEIIAFDIVSQKVLWTNSDYTFQFVYRDKVYCFTQGFEERKYFILDFMTGEQLEELGNNYGLINQLRAEADAAKDWSVYIYPDRLSDCEDENTKNLIDSKKGKLQITGEIEFNVYKNLLLYNFHEEVTKDKFTNRFRILDRNSSNVIFEEVLNENSSALFADSFFIYKNFLFLLKGKTGVYVYCLD
jgi:hypothetical protein